jgi:hypothetical protein
MADTKMQFLPFSAINMFMRPDYRTEVIKKVFGAITEMPEETKKKFNQLTKKLITVPGFRNSAQAPLAVRVKPYGIAFEKTPELAALTLDIWRRANSQVSERVFNLLKSRNWEIYPENTDRTKLPGFMITWPRDETFEAINKAYKAMYPDDETSEDDISLMTVWLSVRLPYQEDDQETE